MATVQSFGTLQTFTPRPRQPIGSAAPYNGTAGKSNWLATLSPQTYAHLYATQPQVRTVVEFIARNIAQLGIHAYRRVSDTDRVRLFDHELIQWLTRPSPGATRYTLIDALMQDLGIYWNAYWLKVRGEDRLGLVRLPPQSVEVEGYLIPSAYVWTLPDNSELRIAPNDLVVFHGYNPDDPRMGLSPLETLRQLLAEEDAQACYRKSYWQNAARIEGVIQRPLAAPKWNSDQKQAWREQWQSRFAGSANAGQIPVLEDGMTFQATSFSAKDSEFTDARKLTREEVAAAYHVPLPMVGILEHATFSNIREQHKNLYQDCLGPWLEFLQEELERQLLPECDDQTDVYVEFNIAEKMKGSFEEQGAVLYSLVGRPVMTANEGRARLNLPAIQDDPSADQLAMPLNTATSGAATTRQLAGDAVAPVVASTWARQRDRLQKTPAADRAATFDLARWNQDLARSLTPLFLASGATPRDAAVGAATLAAEVNEDTLDLLVAGVDPFALSREASTYGR